MSIKENVQALKEELGDVSLVAVSKTKPVSQIKEAIEAGITIIGENRIQEAEQKYKELKDYFKQLKVQFHFVGHLQSNKVKKAVEMFDLIQTVDSLKLALEIDKRAKHIEEIQDVLIQVNTGEESQKHGFLIEDVAEVAAKIGSLGNVSVLGLMCMPPLHEDPRPYFKKMKTLFDQLELDILSMGMTNDYKIAIEEGSTMVRIGTKIFGERI